MDTNILQGKVVVVTGAASGIGRAIAINAARHGAKAVIVSDISETPREGGTPTTTEIEALGVPVSFHKSDVSKREEVEARNRLDGLVYSVEKSFSENKEKLDAAASTEIEAAIAEAKTALAAAK